MARGPLGPRGFSLCCLFCFLIFSLDRWWRGWVGPLIFFLFLFVANCWRGDILGAQLRKDREMTPEKLYKVLDANGLEYEVVEIFEGARILNIEVDDAVKDESETVDQEPSDQDLLNLALSVSSHCRWDGLAICAVFLEALTDANFHMLRERLEDTIKKELKIKSLYSLR
jgi:hypothetical protein